MSISIVLDPSLVAVPISASSEEEAVAIFSVNGESLARQYVRQGHYLRATIVFDRETLARATMEAVIKMLGGGTLPRTILVTESEVITADSQSTMP